MESIRTVYFIGEEFCNDFYRCKENGKVYARQRCDDEYVRWLTTSKCGDGYEPESPLKVGLIMRVVSKNAVDFEEEIVRIDGIGDTCAIKKHKMSWE